MKAAALALILVLPLAACQTTSGHVPSPHASLPAPPKDLVQCFNRSVGNLPNTALTVAEVEKAWKSDRLQAVVMQRCGQRFNAWYDSLRSKWH